MSDSESSDSSGFEVFVCDPYHLDASLYESWVQGLALSAAVARLVELREQEAAATGSTAAEEPQASGSATETSVVGSRDPLLTADGQVLSLPAFPLQGVEDDQWHVHRHAEDQYRVFSLLEPHLRHPLQLAAQGKIPLSLAVREALLDGYYQFDEDVLRHVIGKKVTSKLVKEADDIAERTSRTPTSVRRQLSNLRSMFQCMMGGSAGGELVVGLASQIIMRNFLLPSELAERYTRLLCLCYNRVESSKKRLQALSFTDFDYFSDVFMAHFCERMTTGSNLAIDHGLAAQLREIRTLLTAGRDVSDEFKRRCLEHFQRNASSKHVAAIDGRWSALLKNLLSIAQSLSQPKQFRGVIFSLTEKIVEPLRSRCQANALQASALFIALEMAFPDVSAIPHTSRQALNPSWKRFVDGVRLCVLRLYESMP